MSDEPTQEGWAVPARPPLVALAVLVTVLAGGVWGAGAIYTHLVAPSTRPPPAHFPAPELELTQTPPDLGRRDYAAPPPRGIERAMAETAAKGDALWQGAKP